MNIFLFKDISTTYINRSTLVSYLINLKVSDKLNCRCFFSHCLLIRLQFIIKTQHIFSYLYKLAAYFFFLIFSFIWMKIWFIIMQSSLLQGSKMTQMMRIQSGFYFLSLLWKSWLFTINCWEKKESFCSGKLFLNFTRK